VRHFLGRGFVGKAMMVSIDKATALRVHDKVKKYWAAESERVRSELGRYDLPAADKATLTQRLEVLRTTDMAVIVSPGQNEIEQMKKLGLDIEPHRKRMNESQPGLDEKFKDTDDPLRLVFVCAMWLTGFDAPSCSTIYLDKPMRNHTLMQTIARANRVFPGKQSGVIVDYANVFASLEKALAIYGKGRGGENPVRDKSALVEALREAVDEATAFCASHGVDLAAIEALPTGGLERLEAVEDAIEALVAPDELRREFLAHEKLVVTLYRAIKPDPAALELAERINGIVALAAAVRTRLMPDPPDISEVMGQITGLLDQSIAGLTIRDAGLPAIDLSKVNFAALAQRFKQSKRKNTEIEALKAAIRARLDKLVLLNHTRTHFSERFEELIESYNAGSRNIEQLFEELLKLSRNLDEEQERHVRENLTEEELVVFDILTRPAPELAEEERDEVKKVARDLLTRLKELLVLNWRLKSAARSALRLTIEDTLDAGLPRVYSPDVYREKCSAIFEHVYEKYPERDTGIYTEVA
jgi:type I restriction enzyme, R subunit